jgi:D-serine deaminase-like pyridoxal phosphate-dependent protein
METEFSPTLAGEKDSVTVGADGLTLKSAGQAVALVPADVGAVLLAELAVPKVTVSISTFLAESVTVNVRIPPATGLTVTCGLVAPLTMMPGEFSVHL